ncbi:alpha/beta hydrolase fold-domain-containing protein [Xylariales sp. PMI_506]|nr:alpha/beta hydrolase fold-domain-containing protein [Xylariales sp. PMI_506]
MDKPRSAKDGTRSQVKARLQVLKVVLPRLPYIARVVLLHILGVSEASKYLDLKSDVTISFLRNMLTFGAPQPISKVQAQTLKDPGIKGRIWVSAVATQVPPETSIRDALLATIDLVKGDLVPDDAKCRVPELVPVEAEWTGYRAAATPDSTLPAISESARYKEMMNECKSDVTVLYFHGGAYYLLDPCSHRPTTKKLAKLTGGRVYSVRYRLAPQNPFPAALLDALVSYFTLLYPPPEAIHEAVPSKNIVFSGDSAGGNLSAALLQTLLQLRRLGQKITWFGVERDIPLPAGVALNSPWLDLTQSLPSWYNNKNWDYLPPPDVLEGKEIPPDNIWPSSPPRRHLYIDDAYVMHPLASLHLANSWKESPPIYICTGWECLADESKYLVSKLAKEGVKVVFEEYEAMPHVFAAILTDIPEAKRCFEGWSQFISAAVENPKNIVSSYTTIKAKTLQEVTLDVSSLCSLTEAELIAMATKRVQTGPATAEIPAKL